MRTLREWHLFALTLAVLLLAANARGGFTGAVRPAAEVSMSVVDLLKQRTSIRAFTDQPVDAATVHALLDAARWSPSGGNLQPWQVIAVAGAEKAAVERLATETLLRNPAGEADEHDLHRVTHIHEQDVLVPFRDAQIGLHLGEIKDFRHR